MKAARDVSPDDAARRAAGRLRNLLDQKTGREKRILRRYVVVLEERLRRPLDPAHRACSAHKSSAHCDVSRPDT